MKNIPSNVAVAAGALRQNKAHRQWRRKQLVEKLGLTAKTQHSRLAGVQTRYLSACADPYPPPGCDIYETDEIASIWLNNRAGKKHPDGRGKSKGTWPKLERLDDAKLALIVEANESVIVRDADTGDIVMVVIRNFAGDDEVLDWITDVVDENIGLRRGIRVC
jgi:hypothetical protein